MILRETSGALAIDEYRVRALFQDAAPAHAAFSSTTATNMLTTSPKTAAAAGSTFAATGIAAAQDGVSVIDDGRLSVGGGSEVRLWLMLQLTATSGFSSAQTNFATVYVSAL